MCQIDWAPTIGRASRFILHYHPLVLSKGQCSEKNPGKKFSKNKCLEDAMPGKLWVKQGWAQWTLPPSKCTKGASKCQDRSWRMRMRACNSKSKFQRLFSLSRQILEETWNLVICNLQSLLPPPLITQHDTVTGASHVAISSLLCPSLTLKEQCRVYTVIQPICCGTLP